MRSTVNSEHEGSSKQMTSRSTVIYCLLHCVMETISETHKELHKRVPWTMRINASVARLTFSFCLSLSLSLFSSHRPNIVTSFVFLFSLDTVSSKLEKKIIYFLGHNESRTKRRKKKNEQKEFGSGWRWTLSWHGVSSG